MRNGIGKPLALGRTLAVGLALCVLLSGCGGGTIGKNALRSGDTTGRDAPQVSSAGTAEDSAGTEDAGASGNEGETAPSLGRPPIPQRGDFYTGTTVVFRDRAYTAGQDGIYCLDTAQPGSSPVLTVDDSIVYDTPICTDGFTVYYVDIYGELIEADISTAGNGGEGRNQRQITSGRA